MDIPIFDISLNMELSTYKMGQIDLDVVSMATTTITVVFGLSYVYLTRVVGNFILFVIDSQKSFMKI